MLLSKRILGTVSYMGGIMAIPEPFCWSWAQMIQYNTEYLCGPGEIIHYDRATFSFHSFARNSLIDRCYGDWLIMLDTDHSFDPDIIARLLNMANTYEVDVLSGIYLHKSSPHSPVIYKYNEDWNLFQPIGDWDPNVDLFQIGSSGAGCLFMRRIVWETIKSELKENPFDIIHPFGEDHSFFLRLHKLNIKAFCAPNIECNHLKMVPLSTSDYRKDEVIVGEREMVEGYR